MTAATGGVPRLARKLAALRHAARARLSRSDLALALALFVASCLFFELFARLAEVGFGVSATGLSAPCRWDCAWYGTIVADGYWTEPRGHAKGDAGNWNFFPMLPVLAALPKHLLGLESTTALVVTGKLCFLAGLFVFIRLATLELGAAVRVTAGLVAAFNPYVVYMHAGYSEAIYFLFTGLAFLALARGWWIVAGLAGACLSATRLVGVTLSLAYLVFARRLAAPERRREWPTFLLGLMLCPLGLALYMVFLHFHIGDALGFVHSQVAWGNTPGNPASTVLAAFRAGGWSALFALVALAALAMSVGFALRGRYHYAVFLAAAVLIPLSALVWSMPRYTFWQVPFLLGIVWLLRRWPLLAPLYLVFSAALAGTVIVFWFTGKAFVI